MGLFNKMRVSMGALLFLPLLAMAEGVEPATVAAPAPVQETPALTPAILPPFPAWPPMMAIPGMGVHYMVPQQGMMWPMPFQYPVPMAMPPFVWVMVPVPAMATMPARVDSGPVVEAAVAKLPLPDPESGPAVTDNAGQSLASRNGEIAPTEEATVTDHPSASPASPVPAVAMIADDVPVRPDAIPAGVAVDYGPVAPTPVVDLLALQHQEAIASPPNQRPAISKPVRKPVAGKRSKQPAQVADKPAKKRLCWTKGVVEPCRQ